MTTSSYPGDRVGLKPRQWKMRSRMSVGVVVHNSWHPGSMAFQQLRIYGLDKFKVAPKELKYLGYQTHYPLSVRRVV